MVDQEPATKRPITHDLFVRPSDEQRELYNEIEDLKAKFATLEDENPQMARALEAWIRQTPDAESDSRVGTLLSLQSELADEAEGFTKDSLDAQMQKPLTQMVALLVAIGLKQDRLTGSLSVSGLGVDDLRMAA